jgi:serine kinase of HPr protein (carbohydrate metabolism regulator)
MRIDLGRPMAKGNLILMKGNRNQGKSTVALSTVKQFV